MRNQAPMHKPALVGAPMSDDDGNIWGSLGRDVKAGRVVWEIAVQVPANPNLTKLRRSREAATHVRENLALCLWSVKTVSMQD
jgi:hypothetical protein